MTPNELVDDLMEFIKEEVKNFSLQIKGSEELKAPEVFGGYLPEKRKQQEQGIPDFPHVLVRFLKKKNDKENIASIRIIAGTYSEDVQNGWRDCLNILTRIENALLKKRTIGKAFFMEEPTEMDLFEEQPFPEWVASLTVHFILPKVVPEIGMEW